MSTPSRSNTTASITYSPPRRRPVAGGQNPGDDISWSHGEIDPVPDRRGRPFHDRVGGDLRAALPVLVRRRGLRAARRVPPQQRPAAAVPPVNAPRARP